MVTFFPVPSPLISIHDHPTPYDGTIFTLTSEVELHPTIDSGLTIVGVWSSGDGPHHVQEIASPPYLTNLTFYPLTANSSGEYTLAVTVQPSEDTPFIMGTSANIGYNLLVKRKFDLNLDLDLLLMIIFLL